MGVESVGNNLELTYDIRVVCEVNAHRYQRLAVNEYHGKHIKVRTNHSRVYFNLATLP